jgi:hypothetical protein
MEFNLARLKQLAGMDLVAEADDEDVPPKDDVSPGGASDKEAKQPPKAPAPAANDKPANPFGAKAPAAPAAKKLDPKVEEHRADVLKRAQSEQLDPKLIKASVKHLVTKAHQQAQSGNKEFGDIKGELQHYLDVCHTNLHGRHGFPFANPAASSEDKQNAGEIFDLANSLDHIIQHDLGKKPTEIEGLY